MVAPIQKSIILTLLFSYALFHTILSCVMAVPKRETDITKPKPAFHKQMRDVFVQARQITHKTTNFAMIKPYWLFGKMIVEKQVGAAKTAYGDRLIASLSDQLTSDLGKRFTQANLRHMYLLYLAFPNCHTLCDELSWSHYRLLISVENEEARAYYLEEAKQSFWSVREIQRQINSFYYEHLLDNRTKKRGGKRAAIVPLKPINKMTPRALHAALAQQTNLRRQVQAAFAERTGAGCRISPRTHGNRRRATCHETGRIRNPTHQEDGACGGWENVHCGFKGGETVLEE